MKNWIRFVTLTTVAFSMSACAFMERRAAIKQSEKNPAQLKKIIMVDKEGDETSFSVAQANRMSKETRQDINKIGIAFHHKDYLCAHANETLWRLERQVELKMELGNMIEDLRRQEKPRQLSDADVEQIQRVQVCAPYIMDLKVISKLLQGYDIKRMVY